MSEIMAIFRDATVPKDIKIRAIKKLGEALNYQYASNWTNEIVDELISILKEKGE